VVYVIGKGEGYEKNLGKHGGRESYDVKHRNSGCRSRARLAASREEIQKGITRRRGTFRQDVKNIPTKALH